MNPFIESEKTDRTCLNFRAKEQAKILFMAISAGKKDTFIVVENHEKSLFSKKATSLISK